MTDKELLTYAAKAAGYEVFWDGENNRFLKWYSPNYDEWNPLNDDGQAFRLAIDAYIDAHTQIGDHQVYAQAESNNVKQLNRINGDKYAALRKCITQAAAEIGKGM